MLVLNEGSLFYHDLSSQKTDKSAYGVISDWSSKVQTSTKSSQAWTGASTSAISSARSITSSNGIAIAIKTKDSKPKSQGGARSQATKLFEEDEGDEREVALASPLKGGQRHVNTVCCT